MNKSVIIVKGVSGSGKSSRVFQVIKFFQEIGVGLKEEYFINNEGKSKLIGIRIEGLDIIFIGKIYKSGDVERWQGYDSVTGCFLKSEFFSEYLKQSDNITFVIEGAGVTATNRLRPEFLKDFCGFNKIFIQYYNYDINEKEQYFKRIFDRSGKLPGKGTMWDKVLGFKKDYETSFSDSIKFNSNDCEIKVIYGGFEEKLDDFGVKFFNFFGCSQEFIKKFKNFVIYFDYINKNKFENFK